MSDACVKRLCTVREYIREAVLEKLAREAGQVTRGHATEGNLRACLNRHGVDTQLNMPDWVIAQVVMRLLDSLREAREIESREWAKSPKEAAK